MVWREDTGDCYEEGGPGDVCIVWCGGRIQVIAMRRGAG